MEEEKGIKDNVEEVKENLQAGPSSVSYTHLDVYKRQRKDPVNLYYSLTLNLGN